MRPPESPEGRSLLWREEIPELMMWLESRGLPAAARTVDLDRFLWVGARLSREDLERLVEDGLLRRTEEGNYELTGEGRSRGIRALAEDFNDLAAVRVPSEGPKTVEEEVEDLRSLKAAIDRRLEELRGA